MGTEYRRRALEYAIELVKRDSVTEKTDEDVLLEWGLTAINAQTIAADGEAVERVAQAIAARHAAGYEIGALESFNMRELARAAIAAMRPVPQEQT